MFTPAMIKPTNTIVIAWIRFTKQLGSCPHARIASMKDARSNGFEAHPFALLTQEGDFPD
jgi:hypothetical protein